MWNDNSPEALQIAQRMVEDGLLAEENEAP
jgi:hypothetical protein